MMERVAQLAAAAGQPCVVSLENNMACGFGVCLGCAAPLAAGGYALVCRDGPAFDAGMIAWESAAVSEPFDARVDLGGIRAAQSRC